MGNVLTRGFCRCADDKSEFKLEFVCRAKFVLPTAARAYAKLNLIDNNTTTVYTFSVQFPVKFEFPVVLDSGRGRSVGEETAPVR